MSLAGIAKLAVNVSQKCYLVYLVFPCNILRVCQYFQNEFSVERSIFAILVAAFTNLMPLRRLRRLELKANWVRELQNMNRSIWNENDQSGCQIRSNFSLFMVQFGKNK